MINLKRIDGISEAVKKVIKDESGLRMAAHAAHRDGKKVFSFQGKTYPVKVQGETVGWGECMEETDCVTEPQAKKIAKKEVKKHEKDMHHEEIDPKVRTKDMIRGRQPTKQDDDVGPTSDSKSTKVKYRGGPMAPTSEETVAEAIGIKKVIRNVGSKLLTKLGHGSDEDMKKDLQRKMGVPQTGKKPSDK